MLNNSQNFKSVADLDKAYADHLDSLLVGGFMKKDTPEYSDFMGSWAEAVKDFEESQSKDYRTL
jgi:hypothetical protein